MAKKRKGGKRRGRGGAFKGLIPRGGGATLIKGTIPKTRTVRCKPVRGMSVLVRGRKYKVKKMCSISGGKRRGRKGGKRRGRKGRKRRKKSKRRGRKRREEY